MRVLASLFSTVVLQDCLVRGKINFCAKVFNKIFVFSNLLGDFTLCRSEVLINFETFYLFKVDDILILNLENLLQPKEIPILKHKRKERNDMWHGH